MTRWRLLTLILGIINVSLLITFAVSDVHGYLRVFRYAALAGFNFLVVFVLLMIWLVGRGKKSTGEVVKDKK